MRSGLARAIFLTSILLLLAAAPAVAQEAEEPSAPPSAPAIDLNPLLALMGDGLGRLPERIASAMWEYTGGQVLKVLAAVVGALLWLARAGAAWRELPAVYGAWISPYRYYQRWTARGVWPRILRALQVEEEDV